MNNEFYVGWMPAAPPSFVKHTRKILLLLLTGVIAAGFLLSLSQKKFSSGNFEFGVLTNIKGIYFSDPVPLIRVINGRDIGGRLSYITVPLVGFGKMGAAGVIAGIEQKTNTSLQQREITLKGTLLYNDGKLLLQVDSIENPVIYMGGTTASGLFPEKKYLGKMTIKGEIVDPKCYFGVMKPGQGKPHKDCAIRCILGGIPPVLRVVNAAGEANYYLLAGGHGEKMNEAVKDLVAEPVSLEATAVQYGDWIILYSSKNLITPISKRGLLFPGLTTIECMAVK